MNKHLGNINFDVVKRRMTSSRDVDAFLNIRHAILIQATSITNGTVSYYESNKKMQTSVFDQKIQKRLCISSCP